MAVLPVQLLPPTFAQGYCPPDAQTFANDLMAGTQVSSPIELDNIQISDVAPTDTTKLWFKTLGGAPAAYPAIPLYFWHTSLTAWVAAHAVGAGSSLRFPASVAAAADVDTIDGGSPGTPSAMAGPFWEIDHDFDGRSAMGPGLVPGSNPAKTLGYLENYGEGSHMQAAEEVGPHVHPLLADASIRDGTAKIKVVTPGSGGAGLMIGLTGSALQSLEVAIQTYLTTQLAMLNVHPVRGAPMLKRTSRIYYQG